jgi:SAM-dependent methyltransferase
MDDETAAALNALNVAFYRTHAAEFSGKRTRPWRGWSLLLDTIPQRPLRVLDVGCGNGRFGRFVSDHRPLARYTGLDASDPLLEIARRDPPRAGQVEWIAADFAASDPDDVLPRASYDLIVLFGVLHGIAGGARRQRLVEACRERLDGDGLLVFTCWSFSRDARIRSRLNGTTRTPRGVDPAALDADDHLVPWGDEGSALRYARDLDAAERERLLEATGLEGGRAFESDGPDETHNHYSVVRRAPPGRRFATPRDRL